MSKIMIVAGGNWQIPIIKTAKRMGHYVICSNLYEDSPAFAFADIGEVADVRDKTKNLEIAQKYMPDAILTDQSDIAVPTVAYIADELGLRGIGYDNAKLFTNKFAMREFCRANGFAYPEYQLCTEKSEAKQFLNKNGKSIVKPLDSQSSRGIHVVENAMDIDEYFDDALQYSNVEHAILIEQYIEGREFTVDGIKLDDTYHVTAISKKAHYDYNPSIAKELLFSNYDDEYDYDELREINKAMVCEMNLPFGLTHAEYKYMNGKFYLIEIAARGGGTRISSDIVPIMSGINSNEVYINSLLGIKQRISVNYEKDKYAMLGFFDFSEGKIKNITGIQNALSFDGVVDIGLDIKPGDVIKNAEDDRSRVGYYILKSNSYKGLRALEKKMKSSICIDYEGV